MSTPATSRKSWTVTRIKHPKHPRYTVRVGEWRKGEALHVFWWDDGKQRSRSLGCRRIDLGAGKVAQEREARRLGCEFIEVLAQSKTARAAERASPLTLGRLLDRYTSDGLLKVSAGYRRDTLSSVRRVVESFGAGLLVTDLRPSHLERYLTDRVREGHAPAGRRDLVALAKACRWAEGEEIIEVNPLDKEKARAAMRVRTKIERPFYTLADYEALRAVGSQLDAPAFLPLIALAWHTGRRISALLALRWEHVKFGPTPNSEDGLVTWYAGAVPDKKKFEHETYLNREVHAALFAWRAQSSSGSGYVFPMTGDPSRPMGKTGPKKWLLKAERLAGLKHQKHAGFHCFRRGWVTFRKHMPLPDIMAAGGWVDQNSILRSYQQPTPADTRRAALYIVA